MVRSSLHLTAAYCTMLIGPALLAQGADVSAKIVMHTDKRTTSTAHKTAPSVANVVVWLSPLQAEDPKPAPAPHPPYRLLQKDKQFHPHLLVVPTGTSVEFPNADPFFHNVFSLFNGKRFDLGLYESGTSRSVRFDREGISYIFCNIHPEMGAVVLALSTPYYAVSGDDGVITIHGVPLGSYRMNVWSENAEWLQSAETQRIVQIGIGAGTVRLAEIAMLPVGSQLGNHKNKFGEDYRPEPHPPY
jgi:plastocyanin